MEHNANLGNWPITAVGAERQPGSTTDYKHPLILRPYLEVKRKERVKKRTLPLEGRLSGVEML